MFRVDLRTVMLALMVVTGAVAMVGRVAFDHATKAGIAAAERDWAKGEPAYYPSCSARFATAYGAQLDQLNRQCGPRLVASAYEP